MNKSPGGFIEDLRYIFLGGEIVWWRIDRKAEDLVLETSAFDHFTRVHCKRVLSTQLIKRIFFTFLFFAQEDVPRQPPYQPGPGHFQHPPPFPPPYGDQYFGHGPPPFPPRFPPPPGYMPDFRHPPPMYGHPPPNFHDERFHGRWVYLEIYAIPHPPCPLVFAPCEFTLWLNVR